MMSFEEVSRLAHVRLARSQCETSKKKSDTSTNEEEQNEDDDDDDQSYQQQRLSEDFSRHDSMIDDEELLNIDELDLDILQYLVLLSMEYEYSILSTTPTANGFFVLN